MDFHRKIKIKDCEYTIELLDGVAALDSFGILAKYAGGPIGHMLAAKSVGEMDPDLMAAALRELGQALGSPDMKALVFRMLEGCKVKADASPAPMPLIVQGSLDLFKGHFRGKIADLLQLAWFALKENYSGFSEALPGLAALVQRANPPGQA